MKDATKSDRKRQTYNRKLLLAAWRSDQYKQCRGTIFSNGRYCAIGVAISLLPGTEFRKNYGHRFAKLYHNDYPVHGIDVKLQSKLRRALGVNVEFWRTVIEWNDEEKLSFAKIAKQCWEKRNE